MKNTITWAASKDDVAVIAGKTFVDGIPTTVDGIEYVRFASPLVGGQKLSAKTSTRPELAKLVSEYNAAAATERAEFEAKLAKKRDEQAAADKPHIEKMLAEEAYLVAKIPTDAIRVEATNTGTFDGEPNFEYSAECVKLKWSDIVYLGTPCAIRTGAMGAFDCRRVAYITRAKLAQIIADKKAKTEKAEAENQAEIDRTEAVKSKAIETGTPQILRTWSEERRARECGEWGDYVFACTEYANPDGTTTIKAINQF